MPSALPPALKWQRLRYCTIAEMVDRRWRHASAWSSGHLPPALEIGGVFRVALTLIVRVGRVGAHWAATAGEGSPRRGDGLGRLPLFDPVDRGCEHIETI